MILKRIGVDLGTTNILLYVPGRGIVINEPSVVALEVAKNKVMAIGTEAREMLGILPVVYLSLKRPCARGVNTTAPMPSVSSVSSKSFSIQRFSIE